VVVRAGVDGADCDVEVLSDEDAVYGADDPHPRVAGATLDLIDEGGVHGLVVGPNEDFEVVVDCSAGDETLVRIRFGKHVELTIAVPDDSIAADGPRRSAQPPARERALVAAAAAGDTTACAQLVELFLPAIAGVARVYRGVTAVERAELLQEGVVGLLRAVKRFDPSLGTPFWAYASWWVRQAMQQLVSELTRPIVLSDRAERGLARIKGARRDHLQSHGREPTVAELVSATGLPREQIESLLMIERTPHTLEAPLRADERASGTLGDLIVDPVAEDDYTHVLQRMEIEHVRDLTSGLDDRERLILSDHYGLGRPARTLQQIGDDLGVSAERVRQIEEQTLAKLRAAVAFGETRP
jgi:RNA polymerase primary sigma factor